MSLRILQLLLAIIVGCFVLATAYISNLIVERQSALQQVSRYNTTWTVSQALVEFMRLEQRIAALGVAGSGVDSDEVALRFDILLGRVEILRSGEVGAFIEKDPSRVAIVQRLEAALASVESLLARLDEPTAIHELIAILAPFDAELASLASAANQFGADKVAEDQRELLRLHLLFTGVAAGLIVCGIALIVLLIFNNRMLGRAHGNLRRLADDLEKTSVALQTQNKRFEAALSNMSQGLCMFDAGGRLIVCNHRFGQMFGVSPAAMRPGVMIDEVLADAGANDRFLALKKIYSHQEMLIRDGRGAVFTQEQLDGRTFSVNHEAVAEGGWIATYEDITDRRRVELQIAHMAHFDSLTDLANRVLFRERMEQAVARAKQRSEWLAVLCLDLDRFKEVNDTLGYHFGDELLKIAADRLRACVREGDLVARIGGDEFAILLHNSPEPRNCGDLAGKLIEEISKPYHIEGQEVTTGLSVGIAEAHDASDISGQLLKQADLALHKAKADGRGTFRFFHPDMDAQLQARKALESDLRKALPNGEFEVFYQPVVCAETREISGFEALMRWRHPTRGMIPPLEFIPLAEDIGLIVALGEWILGEACAQAASWPPHMKIAVNLSPAQFRSRMLVQTVIHALASSGVAAGRLELEITETVLLENSDHNLAVLHQLRALGIRISMDDFGTGYSSLSYLRNFPFDKIKIDQSFVRDLSVRADSLAIIRLVTSLAECLGMTTTAEGVETEAQFDQLRAAGCTEVQGYFFGRPKPASKTMLLLPPAGVVDLTLPRRPASAAGRK